ncbi:MAG: hypothetical protein LBC79_04800 [Deltaproteobacteria bacterium]|nr:hypothetical protein [Deltaproteobacteria bacterium]
MYALEIFMLAPLFSGSFLAANISATRWRGNIYARMSLHSAAAIKYGLASSCKKAPHTLFHSFASLRRQVKLLHKIST